MLMAPSGAKAGQCMCATHPGNFASRVGVVAGGHGIRVRLVQASCRDINAGLPVLLKRELCAARGAEGAHAMGR